VRVAVAAEQKEESSGRTGRAYATRRPGWQLEERR
jgi:hypothetical protein